MRYKGGKNGSGVFQRIISEMPPHNDFYGELFLGSGAIIRRKRPAAISHAYELDFKQWLNVGDSLEFLIERCVGDTFRYARPDGSEMRVYNRDAFEALRTLYAAGSSFWGFHDPAQSLIYLDPPYLDSSRSSPGKIYQVELMETDGHAELLKLILAVPCYVMISHYRCDLYDKMLKGWRRVDIPTTNRAGTRVIESVYCNFPEPFELHDYRYLGDGHRERQRIKKKKNRWIEGLERMEQTERYAIIGAILEKRDAWLSEARASDRTAAKIQRKAAAANLPANDAESGVVVEVGLFEE